MLTKTLDIKIFSEQLYQSLKADLDAIAQDHEEIATRASRSLVVVKSALAKLKDFVYEYEFVSKEEEIHFFKVVKPSFVCHYYYFDKILALRVNEPLNGVDTLKTYYYRELDLLQDFIRAHQEFYRYCISDSSQLDEQYFIRENATTDCIDIDCRISTGYDTTLAMIQANQMVKKHIHNLIKTISSEYSESTLLWTGTKTALMELIYALQSVDMINNGKADIKQLATSFETLFNINLGNYYRYMQEMKLRKNGRTNFIDLMKEKLCQRLDDFE